MNYLNNSTPHWIVGERHIYNQLEAWQQILTTKQDFRFYFYEQEYDQFDWTQDPVESWDTLVRARCIQLRQKYKDLRLFYSAGRDSQHVLNSFAQANIPVDELVLMYYQNNPVRHREYHEWILPNAQKYVHINPKVRIRTLTVDQQCYEKYYSDAWLDNQHSNTNHGFFQPTSFPWMIRNLCDVKHSSTGFIVGLDKPKLLLYQNKLFTAILDKGLELHMGSDSIDYFYYAPDLPELHIKQVHLMVNYLNQHYPDADEKFLKEFNNNSHSSYYDEFCISVGRGKAIDITVSAQNGKNKYTGSHEVFRYLQSEAEMKKWTALDHWKYGLTWFSEKYPDAFNTFDFTAGGTKGIYGKHYYICDWPKKNHDPTNSLIT